MIRFVVSNQRGGVAKTTTAVTLSLLLAEQGRRVLLVDTDPQSSVHMVMGFKPERDLYDVIINKLVFADCLHEVKQNLWVLPSTRRTSEVEQVLLGMTARELVFVHYFKKVEDQFDAIIFDVAPSISVLQTCALMYCRQALVPVKMEPLSVQGALSSVLFAESLNDLFQPATPRKVLAFLPVDINRRLAITADMTRALETASTRYHVPILPQVRTDQDVVRAMKERRPITDAYPNSKALEDYRVALTHLLQLLEGEDHDNASTAA